MTHRQGLDNTKHLIFDYSNNPALQNIPAGTQVVVKLTVVLDKTSTNVDGTQFINTAKWWFGRKIDGIDYAPLPGQSGVSPPMTIVGPNLIMTKTAASPSINVGHPLTYTLNLANNGGSDAWNTTIVDKLPSGMCNTDPSSTVTAQIFQADGVTPVGSALTAGTDYSVSWNNSTTPCTLTLNMLSAAARIGPTQRLIINYQAQLDSTQTTSGVTYTNVAGASQWYNDSSSNSNRQMYTGSITDGTPGTADNQDAYTVTSVIAGYYFQKTAQDLTTGAQETASSGLSAYAGDTIRYTLQIQNFTLPQLYGVTVTDDLGKINPGAYQNSAGSITQGPSNLPPGATVTLCDSCGTGGAPKIVISNFDLGSNAQYYVSFDVKLATNLSSGDVVKNQGYMSGTEEPTPSDPTTYITHAGNSDDPLVNGTVDHDNSSGGSVDPTPLTIQVPTALSKSNPAMLTATIGQEFTYQIKVPASPVNIPLYDVKVTDDLAQTQTGANMTFVSASVDPSSPVGYGSWSLVNTGTSTVPVIQDQATGMDIPAGEQAIINVTVRLDDTMTNIKGLNFTNTATYTYNKINGGGSTTEGTTADVTTTPAMIVVEPKLGNATKVVTDIAGNPITAPVSVGDVLKYTITTTNNGDATAYDTSVQDYLPSNMSLVANSATATINGSAVSGFNPTPSTTAAGALAWGLKNNDGSLDIPANQTLVLTYEATVLTANGTAISNSAYIDWSSLDTVVSGERTGIGCGTTGTTAPDDYCIGPLSASVNSTDPTALAKTVDSDTWTTAPSTANDSTVRIGDTLVFNLTATLREGTTDNVVFTDNLPPGLVYDGSYNITTGSSTNFSYSVVSAPAAGSTGKLV
ncbi:MAG: isopeptide-forming domain-containing fimbrial protein, partial [Gammaproteobacteria bacterium]